MSGLPEREPKTDGEYLQAIYVDMRYVREDMSELKAEVRDKNKEFDERLRNVEGSPLFSIPGLLKMVPVGVLGAVGGWLSRHLG